LKRGFVPCSVILAYPPHSVLRRMM
jgi:hypothetical protein